MYIYLYVCVYLFQYLCVFILIKHFTFEVSFQYLCVFILIKHLKCPKINLINHINQSHTHKNIFEETFLFVLLNQAQAQLITHYSRAEHGFEPSPRRVTCFKCN